METGGVAAVRLRFSPERCIASGECARALPEVFGQSEHDGTAVLRTAAPPPSLVEVVREAVADCPSGAIALVEG